MADAAGRSMTAAEIAAWMYRKGDEAAKLPFPLRIGAAADLAATQLTLNVALVAELAALRAEVESLKGAK